MTEFISGRRLRVMMGTLISMRILRHTLLLGSLLSVLLFSIASSSARFPFLQSKNRLEFAVAYSCRFPQGLADVQGGGCRRTG